MPDCIGSIEASVYKETDVWIRNMEDFTFSNAPSCCACFTLFKSLSDNECSPFFPSIPIA